MQKQNKIIMIIRNFLISLVLVSSLYAGDDFTQWSDSLRKGADTVNTHDIAGTYGKTFKYITVSHTDTGATYTDSIKVYGIDEKGYESELPVRLLSDGSNVFTDYPVISKANKTTRWLILQPNLERIKIVFANAVYVANQKEWYTLILSDD